MKKKITGMILSLENERAVVLTPEGQFLKTTVKGETHFVGDEITFTINEGNFLKGRGKALSLSAKGLSLKKPIFQAAFSMCMILVAGISSWAYPTGHIYMDVNPSLGMSYNIYHRVIGVESFNEDGAKVINKVSVYGNTLVESLEKTFKVLDEQGYIKGKEEGTSGVLLGFTDPKIENEMVNSLIRTSETLDKTLQVEAMTIKPVSEEIAKEQKGQKDILSPIEAEIAGQKMKDNFEISGKVNKDKAEMKAEIKALVKKIKEEKAKALQEEKAKGLKEERDKKAEKERREKREKQEKLEKQEKQEKREKQEKQETQERQDKKDKQEIQQKQEQLETSLKSEIEDRPARIEKIDKEVAQLMVLLETLQEAEGKDKQRELKIKKIIKRIEGLKREKIKLETK